MRLLGAKWTWAELCQLCVQGGPHVSRCQSCLQYDLQGSVWGNRKVRLLRRLSTSITYFLLVSGIVLLFSVLLQADDRLFLTEFWIHAEVAARLFMVEVGMVAGTFPHYLKSPARLHNTHLKTVPLRNQLHTRQVTYTNLTHLMQHIP
jgi:hypothetical protein